MNIQGSHHDHIKLQRLWCARPIWRGRRNIPRRGDEPARSHHFSGPLFSLGADPVCPPNFAWELQV